MKVFFTEKQYKKYCDFCSQMANLTDVLEGSSIHQKLEKWIEKEHLTDLAVSLMDQRMEKECGDEMKQEKKSHLHIV